MDDLISRHATDDGGRRPHWYTPRLEAWTAVAAHSALTLPWSIAAYASGGTPSVESAGTYGDVAWSPDGLRMRAGAALAVPSTLGEEAGALLRAALSDDAGDGHFVHDLCEAAFGEAWRETELFSEALACLDEIVLGEGPRRTPELALLAVGALHVDASHRLAALPHPPEDASPVLVEWLAACVLNCFRRERALYDAWEESDCETARTEDTAELEPLLKALVRTAPPSGRATTLLTQAVAMACLEREEKLTCVEDLLARGPLSPLAREVAAEVAYSAHELSVDTYENLAECARDTLRALTAPADTTDATLRSLAYVLRDQAATIRSQLSNWAFDRSFAVRDASQQADEQALACAFTIADEVRALAARVPETSEHEVRSTLVEVLSIVYASASLRGDPRADQLFAEREALTTRPFQPKQREAVLRTICETYTCAAVTHPQLVQVVLADEAATPDEVEAVATILGRHSLFGARQDGREASLAALRKLAGHPHASPQAQRELVEALHTIHARLLHADADRSSVLAELRALATAGIDPQRYLSALHKEQHAARTTGSKAASAFLAAFQDCGDAPTDESPSEVPGFANVLIREIGTTCKEGNLGRAHVLLKQLCKLAERAHASADARDATLLARRMVMALYAQRDERPQVLAMLQEIWEIASQTHATPMQRGQLCMALALVVTEYPGSPESADAAKRLLVLARQPWKLSERSDAILRALLARLAN